MGESRGDKVRIWTDVPLHKQLFSQKEEKRITESLLIY
jgi:hypothetical protein